MENKSNAIPENVPYIVFESSQARSERHIKRLVIALIVSIIALLACNCAWLYAWMQYDYTSDSTETIVEAQDGVANYIGNDGDIINGEDNRS